MRISISPWRSIRNLEKQTNLSQLWDVLALFIFPQASPEDVLLVFRRELDPAVTVQQVDLVGTVGVRKGEEEVVGVQTDAVQPELRPLVSHPVCQYSVPVQGLIHLNPSEMDIICSTLTYLGPAAM